MNDSVGMRNERLDRLDSPSACIVKHMHGRRIQARSYSETQPIRSPSNENELKPKH